MSGVLSWKEIRKIEDILDMRDPSNGLDFVIYRSMVGVATIVYFRNREVQEQLEPLLTFENHAQYAGHDGVRIEQRMVDVREYLSTLSEVKEKIE